MTPLEYFLCYELSFNPYDVNEWELNYETDNSEYHIVDNEEADHGTIKYFHDGIHICNYNNYGGDSYDFDYTSEGIKHFKQLALEIFNQSLNKIKE